MAASTKTIESYDDALSEELQEVVARLRPLIDAALPAAEGVVWHGHPVWKQDGQPVAGYKAYGAHVTFMLWNGARVEDPSGRLQASGARDMASVKLRSPGDVDAELFSTWLDAVGAP